MIQQIPRVNADLVCCHRAILVTHFVPILVTHAIHWDLLSRLVRVTIVFKLAQLLVLNLVRLLVLNLVRLLVLNHGHSNLALNHGHSNPVLNPAVVRNPSKLTFLVQVTP